MTNDEKLAATLAAVQTDPGNRGLARDPHDNLFTATAGDFQAACQLLAADPAPSLGMVTGFFIPTGTPPAAETDGPLGAVFLARALYHLARPSAIDSERHPARAIAAGLAAAGVLDNALGVNLADNGEEPDSVFIESEAFEPGPMLLLAIERVGPAADGGLYTMRGCDVSRETLPLHVPFAQRDRAWATIGIGDGGNEIGMGKIPHETIAKNIPNGDLIHCRVPTDHLIVAGVSNWGAYALAAGVYVLRGVKPPADLFDPDRECEILEVMVREGPLVDGVTGKQTATVDGLTWPEYAAPLVRIREILET
jgi:hypothetical protein